MSDLVVELVGLPPDLEAWGWRMQHYKPGPRKHPGGWYQYIFGRIYGMAKGDEDLDPEDESLRVKVRRSTREEAYTEAVRLMRERSAHLEKSGDCQRLLDENRRIIEEMHAEAEAWRRNHGS